MDLVLLLIQIIFIAVARWYKSMQQKALLIIYLAGNLRYKNLATIIMLVFIRITIALLTGLIQLPFLDLKNSALLFQKRLWLLTMAFIGRQEIAAME